MGSVRGHTASDLAHELQAPGDPMIITLMFVHIVFGLLKGLGVNGGMDVALSGGWVRWPSLSPGALTATTDAMTGP